MSLQTDSEVFLVNEGFALPFLLKQPLAKSTSSKAIILLHGVSNENYPFGLSNELPDNLLIIPPGAQPIEVLKSCTLLASDESSYITHQSMS